MFRITACFALACLSVAACSSDADPPASTNGVDDVRDACELRLSWKAGSSSRCSYCLAAVANPPCECSEQHDFAGLCEEQQAARSREPSCEGVEECRFECGTGDCACVDACYRDKDACRKAASALDGCVAEVCAPECNVE